MATRYVKSGSGVAEFAQSNAYSQGDRMVPKRADTAGNYFVGRRWVWECTTAGTSAAAEPTWAASVTQDVTTLSSGTATFTARAPGFSSGTTADWTFATIYTDYLNNVTSGDVVYISNNHNEAIGAALSFGTAGVYYTCVDDSAAPPTAETTGAIISTSGAFNLSVGGAVTSSWQGITFKCGIGDTGNRILTASAFSFENCTFELSTSGSGASIQPGVSISWSNCYVKFSHASQTIQGAPRVWSGGGLASGGTSPTNLWSSFSVNVGVAENLDFSQASAGVNLCGGAGNLGRMDFVNIKMPASWSGAVNASAAPYLTANYRAYNVGTTASAVDFNYKQRAGSCDDETTIIKTSGDSPAEFAYKLANLSTAGYPYAFTETLPVSRYNSSTSAITVTVDVLTDSLTNLTDKDVILEVRYPSAADSPLGSMATSDPGYFATAADLTASTAEWTTTGLTNPNKQKVSVTFTPARAGYIQATVKVTKASTTVYVDPQLQVA